MPTSHAVFRHTNELLTCTHTRLTKQKGIAITEQASTADPDDTPYQTKKFGYQLALYSALVFAIEENELIVLRGRYSLVAAIQAAFGNRLVTWFDPVPRQMVPMVRDANNPCFLEDAVGAPPLRRFYGQTLWVANGIANTFIEPQQLTTFFNQA